MQEIDIKNIVAAAPGYIDFFPAPMTGRPYIIFNKIPGAKSYIFRLEWNYKNKLLQAGSSYATYELAADDAPTYPVKPAKSFYESHGYWMLPVFDSNYAIPVSAQVYTKSYNGALNKSVYDLNLRNTYGDYYTSLSSV